MARDIFKERLEYYLSDPRDPEFNFMLGHEYFHSNQYAAALSYYLRCAELHTDIDVIYECLIKTWQCLNQVGGRPLSAITQLEHAINLCPTRPEAYYLISTVYEKDKEWFKCYHYASLGHNFTTEDHAPLRSDVGYPGNTALLFMKSVAAWFIGQRAEAKKLSLQHFLDVSTPDNLRSNTRYNLVNLGIPEDLINRLEITVREVKSIK